MSQPNNVTATNPAEFVCHCQNSVAVRIELAFDDATSLETVCAILEQLPEDWRLFFYDRDYRSPSEPGSYVEVARQGDRFLFQRRNYHWHGLWQKRKLEKMAEIVHRCRGHKDPDGQIHMYVEREIPLTDREIEAARKSY